MINEKGKEKYTKEKIKLTCVGGFKREPKIKTIRENKIWEEEIYAEVQKLKPKMAKPSYKTTENKVGEKNKSEREGNEMMKTQQS